MCLRGRNKQFFLSIRYVKLFFFIHNMQKWGNKLFFFPLVSHENFCHVNLKNKLFFHVSLRNKQFLFKIL